MATTDRFSGFDMGVAVKPPVAVASTGNLTLSATQTVDGIAVGSGERVLVKDQTTASENGIYISDSSTWIRSKDCDGNKDLIPGSLVYVDRGTLYAQSFWVFNSSSTLTSLVVGTNDLDLTQTTLSLSGASAFSQNTLFPLASAAAWHSSDGLDLDTALITSTGSTHAIALSVREARLRNLYDFGANGDGVTSDSTALDKADTAAGGVGHIVCSTGSFLIDSNQTIDSVVHFAGGEISVPSSVTVTFDKAVIAGSHKIFNLSGTGAVVLNRKYNTEVHPEWFSTDIDETSIQAAVTVAQANDGVQSGGIVKIPSGFASCSSVGVSVTGGVIIEGAGIGAGTGVGNSGGTVIRSTAADGDVFTVNTDESVIFRNFMIDAPDVTKSAGTAGIRFEGSSTGTVNRRSRVENMRIIQQYDGVVTQHVGNFVFSQNIVQNYLNIGLYLKQTGGVDTGDNKITDNTFWDLSVGNSQACVRYDKGGTVYLKGNKLLGSNYGFRAELDDGPTGIIHIENNSIEEQTGMGISINQVTTGLELALVHISDNQFQISNASSTAQRAIIVNNGTPDTANSWVRLVSITNNTIQNFFEESSDSQIDVLAGQGVDISGNLINLSGKANLYGIRCAGDVEDAFVRDNMIINPSSTGRIFEVISTNVTLIHHQANVDFAHIVAPRNGSVMYITDGVHGSNPLAGSSNGAFAYRINNAWRG